MAWRGRRGGITAWRGNRRDADGTAVNVSATRQCLASSAGHSVDECAGTSLGLLASLPTVRHVVRPGIWTGNRRGPGRLRGVGGVGSGGSRFVGRVGDGPVVGTVASHESLG